MLCTPIAPGHYNQDEEFRAAGILESLALSHTLLQEVLPDSIAHLLEPQIIQRQTQDLWDTLLVFHPGYRAYIVFEKGPLSRVTWRKRFI